MKKRIIHYFNLIEIAMALGIIGFGVTSVMSVFPIALQNANNSISENYASSIADIFYAYINQGLKMDPSLANGHADSYYDSDGTKRHGKFDGLVDVIVTEPSKPANLSDTATLAATNTAERGTAWSSALNTADPVQKNIFPGEAGVFKVTQGTDPTDPEFSAVLRVWRASPDSSASGNSGVSMAVINNTGGYTSIGIDDNSVYKKTSVNGLGSTLTGIFVEVSWPSHKPYGMRDKRLYYKEIYDIYD